MTPTSLVKLDQTEIVSAMCRAISGSWINRGPNIKKKDFYVEQKKHAVRPYSKAYASANNSEQTDSIPND